MCGIAGVSGEIRLAIAQQARKAQAQSVLVIFEQGGISHTDTWDPKPEANPVHRSPFKTISTNVPGM